VIKLHGISIPEGAALSWPLSDIVIRRKNGFAFRCPVRGYSLLDQRPVSAHLTIAEQPGQSRLTEPVARPRRRGLLVVPRTGPYRRQCFERPSVGS
jgi:hypothetical protein